MFTFTLEEVLQHRKRIQEEMQKKFTDAKTNMHKLMNDLEELEQEKKNQMIEWGKEIRKGFNFNLQEIYLVYIEQLEEKIELKNKELEQAKQLFIEAQNKLMIALKDHEVLEELKKKELQKYNESVKREELKILSEIAIINYGKQ